MPNVCFPCATLQDAVTGRIALYYGCADTYVGPLQRRRGAVTPQANGRPPCADRPFDSGLPGDRFLSQSPDMEFWGPPPCDGQRRHRRLNDDRRRAALKETTAAGCWFTTGHRTAGYGYSHRRRILDLGGGHAAPPAGPSC